MFKLKGSLRALQTEQHWSQTPEEKKQVKHSKLFHFNTCSIQLCAWSIYATRSKFFLHWDQRKFKISFPTGTVAGTCYKSILLVPDGFLCPNDRLMLLLHPYFSDRQAGICTTACIQGCIVPGTEYLPAFKLVVLYHARGVCHSLKSSKGIRNLSPNSKCFRKL